MNEVERIHEDLKAIGQIVNASKDVSAISGFGEHSSKTLLLAGASYFERRIISSIGDHINAVTESRVLRHFTFHQAVERKFFSLFDFNGGPKNINAFFKKFGPEYSKWAKTDVAARKDIDQLAFLNFCSLRNSLVHNNYATYSINKTLDEVWGEFRKAEMLVSWIENSFSRFNKVINAAGAVHDGQDNT